MQNCTKIEPEEGQNKAKHESIVTQRRAKLIPERDKNENRNE